MWKINRPGGRPGPTVIVRMQVDNVGNRSFATSRQTGTTRQLGEAFPERQRRELQALCRGEIRKNHVGKIVDAEQHLQINDLS